jgi:hypothetical protein
MDTLHCRRTLSQQLTVCQETQNSGSLSSIQEILKMTVPCTKTPKFHSDFRKSFTKTCRTKTNKEVHAQIEHAMDDEVAFTYFQAALMDIKKNAAQDPPQITVNMANSCWSAVTQFAVFEHIYNL